MAAYARWPAVVRTYARVAPAVALGVFQWSCLRIGRLFGGPRVAPAHWWVPFFLPVIAPIEVGVSMVHKKVEWRGRAYELDADAHLA